jgi:hypothetical protein
MSRDSTGAVYPRWSNRLSRARRERGVDGNVSMNIVVSAEVAVIDMFGGDIVRASGLYKVDRACQSVLSTCKSVVCKIAQAWCAWLGGCGGFVFC